MNDQILAHKAYAQSQRSVGSPRAIEYQVFARVTRDLRHAEDSGSYPRLAEALHSNIELWTVIAADVAGEKNGLPRELRANLFNLCEFTRQHSKKVLRREADVSALIDINTAVMKGLRGPAKPGDE
ncbi:MAG: flagellar biosynthesis regulator FlaF [Parvularculaceae bacterium]|nr:flagellar biosynthesis regulator FlaF [Parvularculaceae bacterium]